MWSRASTDMAVGQHAVAVSRCVAGRPVAVRASLLRAPARAGVACVASVAVALLLSACESAPSKPTETVSQPVAAGTQGGAAPGTQAGLAGTKGGTPGAQGAAPAAGSNVPVTARGKADFDRAVGFMRSGNNTEAELEFKQVALQFPQLSAPYVNLGILYRKTGRLDQSEDALKTAVEHNDGSAVAWTELGATQRLRGEFPNAAASYEKAIAADPNFAPAYRNLGVVSDLYLGDPERALTAFERYKELTGEEKPINGWIAELRARTGKPPLKRPSATPPAGSPDAAGSAPANGDPASGAAAPGAPAPSQTSAPGQKPAEQPPAAAPPPKAGE
jgi:Flp pilus assembly protein TadD